MSYGLTCEHEGCRSFATLRSATPIRFYCAQHGPDGELLTEVRREDHGRYMDNENARRWLVSRGPGEHPPPSPVRATKTVSASAAREQQRAHRADKLRKGLCSQCWDRAAPGRSMCDYHLRKNRTRLSKRGTLISRPAGAPGGRGADQAEP